VPQDMEPGRRELLRLADEILPALIARLGVSSLGEIEVRQGDWRIRLRRARRPAVAESGRAGERRRTARERSRTSAAASATSSAIASSPSPTGSQTAPSSASAAVGPRSRGVSGNGAGRAPVAVGPGMDRMPAGDVGGSGAARGPRRTIATSPAVGYFVPRDGLALGHATRSGDVIGHIDVLGVRQDVVAPADGVVGDLFVEPGEAVEYGQELLRVDPTTVGRAAGSPA
jgi:biotin carboxyl carrier protein